MTSRLFGMILIVAFPVIIGFGFVVMNWESPFKAVDVCKNLAISIENIGPNQACLGDLDENQYINFILHNIGSSDITGITVLATGDKGSGTIELSPISFPKEGTFSKTDKLAIYDTQLFGKIKNIQFYPKSGTEFCPKKSIKADNIGTC